MFWCDGIQDKYYKWSEFRFFANQPAASYEINFVASGLPSGIYLYKLQSGGFVQTKKMIFLK